MLNAPENEPEKVEIRGYIDSRLRDVIVADSLERRLPLSECVAQALAKAYDLPELAAVPRKRIGRPLKVKDATNGKPHKSSKPRAKRSAE